MTVVFLLVIILNSTLKLKPTFLKNCKWLETNILLKYNIFLFVFTQKKNEILSSHSLCIYLCIVKVIKTETRKTLLYVSTPIIVALMSYLSVWNILKQN